jgi:hypothetical protein
MVKENGEAARDYTGGGGPDRKRWEELVKQNRKRRFTDSSSSS